MAKDPVCGMECDPKSSDKVEYKGETYYFCAPGCKSAFEKDPERYLKAEQRGEHHGMHHGGHHH
ncbi:MAG: YHS domain-containing protein [Chloroflexota bacterium]